MSQRTLLRDYNAPSSGGMQTVHNFLDWQPWLENFYQHPAPQCQANAYERTTFSKVGDVIRKKRSSLKPNKADQTNKFS
jgi:hypothetical protein